MVVQKPSFTKSLFFGDIEEKIVSPFPHISKEEKESVDLLRESIDKFAEEYIDSPKFDKEAKLPKEVLQKMGELGLFGLTIPQEYGGFGFSQTAYCKVIEELVAHDSSVSITMGGHLSIGLKALLFFGTEEQKKKYLPDLAAGKKIAAFSLTEPTAGSDAAAIKTRAELTPDGKYYILNGSKIWITNGGFADFFTVFAQTKGPDGKDHISAFIVTRDTPGFSTGQEEQKLGIKASSTTSAQLNNCKIPAENLLGQLGHGFKVAMNVLNSGRLGLAAGCLGGQKHLIKLCTEYAKERKTFGKSISEYGLIKKKIAQMMREAYATESLVYLTTGLVDRGDIDYSIESAICKIYGSEALWRTVNEALQICAGNGYMKDYPYEQILRDTRINMIFEGTNEILRLFVALSGMQAPGEKLKEVGRALKEPIKSLGLLSEFAVKKIKRSLTVQHFKTIHPIFKNTTARLEGHINDISRQAEKVLIRHGKKIVEKQFAMERISEMIIEVYLMTACLLRATDHINKCGLEKSPIHVLIVKELCSRSLRRLRHHLRAADKNDDEGIKEVAAYAYEKNGYDLDLD